MKHFLIGFKMSLSRKTSILFSPSSKTLFITTYSFKVVFFDVFVKKKKLINECNTLKNDYIFSK